MATGPAREVRDMILRTPSDSRNFRQAFKKWTDTTPSSLRAHH